MSNPIMWTTKDGQKIPVPEIPDTHLVNICKMLNRNADTIMQHVLYSAYALEASLQGEMALDGIGREIAAMENGNLEFRDVYPIAEAVFFEAEKRGLEYDDTD